MEADGMEDDITNVQLEQMVAMVAMVVSLGSEQEHVLITRQGFGDRDGHGISTDDEHRPDRFVERCMRSPCAEHTWRRCSLCPRRGYKIA